MTTFDLSYKCPKCLHEMNIGSENKRLICSIKELQKDSTALKDALREAVTHINILLTDSRKLNYNAKDFIKKAEELLK